MPPDQTVRFVINQFSKFYKEAPLTMPDRFSKREFGFMFFDRNFVMRHLAFPSRAQLKKYLVENVPSHAYYSSAYYEIPNAPTMTEKKWLGADLIFDLDADHVKGAEGLSYEEMLAKVKDELRRLLDDFIIGDMGFDHRDVKIVFSGGRGYHLHISHKSVLGLNSHNRREIVDYITGTSLDFEWVFPLEIFDIRKVGDRLFPKRRRIMPKSTDGGWRARMRKGLDRLLDSLDKLPESERLPYMKGQFELAGVTITEKTLVGLAEELFEGNVGMRRIDRIRDEGNIEVFSKDEFRERFLDLVRKVMAVEVAGETDEPVTSDIKRLIRLPGSLHGKTGFEVVPMYRDQLDGFDPFNDAVSKVFGSAPVRVTVDGPVSMRLKGERFSLHEGENEVPEFAAVYLVCRRLASVANH